MNGQYGVVVHITTGEATGWERALRNLRNLVTDESVPTPTDRMQVVVNGPAVGFLVESGPAASKLRGVLDAGVTVSACANSLERFGHDPAALLEGVTVVESGIAEAVRTQQHGSSYLKLP